MADGEAGKVWVSVKLLLDSDSVRATQNEIQRALSATKVAKVQVAPELPAGILPRPAGAIRPTLPPMPPARAALPPTMVAPKISYKLPAPLVPEVMPAVPKQHEEVAKLAKTSVESVNVQKKGFLQVFTSQMRFGVGMQAQLRAVGATFGAGIPMLGTVIGIALLLLESVKVGFSVVGRLIGAIQKLIGVIIMQFVNILMPFLLPLIWMLTPLVKMVNMLLRPMQTAMMDYIKANKAMLKDPAKYGSFFLGLLWVGLTEGIKVIEVAILEASKFVVSQIVTTIYDIVSLIMAVILFSSGVMVNLLTGVLDALASLVLGFTGQKEVSQGLFDVSATMKAAWREGTKQTLTNIEVAKDLTLDTFEGLFDEYIKFIKGFSFVKLDTSGLTAVQSTISNLMGTLSPSLKSDLESMYATLNETHTRMQEILSTTGLTGLNTELSSFYKLVSEGQSPFDAYIGAVDNTNKFMLEKAVEANNIVNQMRGTPLPNYMSITGQAEYIPPGGTSPTAGWTQVGEFAGGQPVWQQPVTKTPYVEPTLPLATGNVLGNIYNAATGYLSNLASTLGITAQEGGYVARGGLALIHKGEQIIPEEKAGGQNVYVNMNMNVDGILDEATRRKIMEVVDRRLAEKTRMISG